VSDPAIGVGEWKPLPPPTPFCQKVDAPGRKFVNLLKFTKSVHLAAHCPLEFCLPLPPQAEKCEPSTDRNTTKV